MRALGCWTKDQVDSVIDNYASVELAVDWDLSDSWAIAISIPGRGIFLEYPFGLSEFWETLDDLVGLAMAVDEEAD